MRIAHAGSKGIPSRGGTERVVEAIARRHARDHQVTVYGSRLVCESGSVGGVRVRAVPALRAKHAGPVCLQATYAVDALLRGDYDVVHLHGAENAFILPILRLRFPVVTTYHGPAYEREKWSPGARRVIRSVERMSVVGASAATAVAGVQAERLCRSYRRAVSWIPNGVDLDPDVDEDGARALLHELGLEPGHFWMFAAARVDPTKGCLTLIQAHRETAEEPLLVVGDLYHAPGHEEGLRRAARDDVRFVPRLDDKAVLLGLLRQARLFVFPSTVEAMSMMLLEAVGQRTLTLAGDIPENTTILPDWFPTFRAGDAGDLARKAKRLLELEPDVAGALTAEAAQWVGQRFDWNRIADQYMEVYERIARRRGNVAACAGVRLSVDGAARSVSDSRHTLAYQQQSGVIMRGSRRAQAIRSLWQYHSANAERHASHDFANVFEKTFRDLRAYGVDDLKGLKLLDLGCGQRFPLSLMAASRGATVTALDVTWIEPRLTPAAVVRTARHSGVSRAGKTLVRSLAFDRRYYRRLEKLSGAQRADAASIEFVRADPHAGRYPLESGAYDLAISIAVLEHVKDVTAVAAEVSRVLRPGGVFYGIIHNYYSLSGGHRLEWAYPDEHAPADIQPWDHLRECRYPPDYYLNRLKPEEYREALGGALDVLLFERRDEEHDPGGLEGEQYLVGDTAKALSEYPRELLLTRSWCVIARKDR